MGPKAELDAFADNYAPRAKVRRKRVTYAQLIASCQAFDTMIKAGVIENLAIRSLAMVIGVYADEVHGEKHFSSRVPVAWPRAKTGGANTAPRASPSRGLL
jgi:hypothetical protein